DGTDAVMLSGETAIGRDPAGVVGTMAAVAERAECEASYRAWANRLGREQPVDDVTKGERITMALTHAASQAAIDGDVSAILCCTRSGRTARAMARFRPEATMVGLSPDAGMARRMALIWGVDPLVVDLYDSTDDMVWHAVETAIARGEIEHGDTVLVLAGSPDHGRITGVDRPATDVLRLVQVA
ncbi:MAG: pyruvate kinase alpha/beta domain-containing protein, partial [Actinomycetota bacterium]